MELPLRNWPVYERFVGIWDNNERRICALYSDYALADAEIIVAAVNGEAALREENERLRAALERIVSWSDAYPVEVFVPATPEQLAAIRQLLQDHGYSLDSLSAQAMRHVVTGVGEIARAALDGTPADAGLSCVVDEQPTDAIGAPVTTHTTRGGKGRVGEVMS